MLEPEAGVRSCAFCFHSRVPTCICTWRGTEDLLCTEKQAAPCSMPGYDVIYSVIVAVMMIGTCSVDIVFRVRE